MAELTLLHTSDAHIARFDAIAARIAPDAVLQHRTRPQWLDAARKHGLTDRLKAEFSAFVQAQPRPVLCTCTTLGPLADTAGAIRIDRPMMHEAAKLGGPVAMAYCVESTCAPSSALLRENLAAAGHAPKIRAIAIPEAWLAFEAGDMAGYGEMIARAIGTHLAAFPNTRAVVLAQASMDVAASLLSDLDQPVLAPAESALRAALRL